VVGARLLIFAKKKQKMRVDIFPSGGVHSMYLDMAKHPPNGVEYYGDFRYAPSSKYSFPYKSIARRVLDAAKLPYVFSYENGVDCDVIHSCQKILFTDEDYVVDIEHGNPFMGADKVFKYKWPQFRFAVNKLLKKNNCLKVMPWTKTAYRAFYRNFFFLGSKFFHEKVDVVYPATDYAGMHHKTKEFTFTFVGGNTWDTFYSKGGVQVLEAAEALAMSRDDFKVNFVSKFIPQKYVDAYGSKSYINMAYGLPRDKLMELLTYSDVLLMPSICDTFGIVA